MDGLKPTHPVASLSFSTPRPVYLSLLSQIKDSVREAYPDLDGAIIDSDMSHQNGLLQNGRLVAVKMMDLAVCDANDRTRISFVREVEVLRVSISIQRRSRVRLHC